jgi:acyl-CoA thioesterase
VHHPYAELIGLVVEDHGHGHSACSLQVAEHHLNPHRVVHGAVIFALADTGMGAALYPTLAAEERCATIDVKINYFKPVVSGLISCKTSLVNKGRTVAHLESKVYSGETLVAQASGNYAIFPARKDGQK